MHDVRAIFSKTGRAVYISHLDLNRCMQRAFRRSKLPIWYTEGFNPHPYIMFALALSLGFESRCEVMDFTLTEEVPFDEIKQRLNDVLPEGLEIISVSEPVRKHKEIESAEFEVKMFSENPDNLKDEFTEFMKQEKLIVLKRNKKKQMIETDIKPFVEVLGISADDEKLTVSLRLPAGTQKNYNPTLLTDIFSESAETDISMIKTERKKIICGNDEPFM
ncbi:MAG: TIGR03936 family radical SAM-associated protein [Oscillospiraceae bacterium]